MALKQRFLQDKGLCANFGIKPANVFSNNWKTKPWIVERELEELFIIMEEDEEIFDQVVPSRSTVGDVVVVSGEAVVGDNKDSTYEEVSATACDESINDEEEVDKIHSELRHVYDGLIV